MGTFECCIYSDPSHLQLIGERYFYRWVAHNDSNHYCYQLWSNTGCCGSFIREEAFQEKYLPNTNNKKDDGFPDRPIGHSCVQILCSAAALRFPQAEVSLIIDDRLQSLMNWNTCRLHLEKQTNTHRWMKNPSVLLLLRFAVWYLKFGFM